MALVGLAVPHAVLGGMKIVSWIKRIRGKGAANVMEGTGTGVSKVAGEAVPTEQKLGSRSLESPRRTIIPRARKDIASWTLLALLGIVATGLVRLRSEGKAVGAFMATRYEAVLQKVEPSWLRI